MRKGNFLFNVFRHSLDSYSGCVLITKPGYERTVTHTHIIPDECSIFDFNNDFSGELSSIYGKTKFFSDNDLHSTLVRSKPELEWMHYYILHLIKERGESKLQLDNLVMEIINRVLHAVTDYKPDYRITAQLKKNHLHTIESAKQYMALHFGDDISLMEIARHCHVSPFHFSRVFKTFTGTSPHQFLLAIRLQHAALLLQDTSLPITDIAFAAGFNSIEHFTAAFRQKFGSSPSLSRNAKKNLLPEISKIP
ncbi:MAG TPA: AraC family transcriptional regulator [Chitinophagaceae bacterium]